MGNRCGIRVASFTLIHQSIDKGERLRRYMSDYKNPQTTCRKCGGSACTNPLKPALALDWDNKYCHDCYMTSDKADVQIVGSYMKFNHTKAQWNKVHRAAEKLKTQGYTINTEYTDSGRRCFARVTLLAYRFY